MQTLRNANLIARLVLVWFALFVAAAAASPLVKPTDIQLVCAGGGGIKLSASGDDGADNAVSSGMDCPLCAMLASPLPEPAGLDFKPSPLAHALRPLVAAHIAAATAPPMPSRGPPASIC